MWLTVAAGFVLMAGISGWAFQNELAQWLTPHPQLARQTSAAVITVVDETPASQQAPAMLRMSYALGTTGHTASGAGDSTPTP
jgi:hypothetical protein